MVVFILAAGYATRLYPYTQNTAKPLLVVNGKPIIDYIAEQVITLPDVKKIVVITNDKFFCQFEEWNASKGNSLIKILNDGTKSVDARLGAIGDIQFAIESEGVDDELVVIAGDNLFTYNLSEFYDYFKKLDKDCVCVKDISDKEALKNLGVCELDESNKLIGFVEKPEKPVSNKAVFATYMFKKSSLHYIREFLKVSSKKDAPGYFIEWLHKKTDVYAYIMNGECYDIGTVCAYEEIQKTFK